MPPGGNGRVWLVFTGINAPVFRLTDRAQLPSSSKLKNPPGHRPSFLAIEIDCEVAPPAVLPSAALAAIDHALPNLGDVQVDGDAFLSPFIAQPAPVAGEGRARPEIASVWIFRRRILCSNLYVERNSEHS